MTTPLTWINDRLPTEADGDEDGCVIVSTPTQRKWYKMYFRFVSWGQSWLPFTTPAAAPEPATPASQPRPPFTPPGATPEPAAAAVTTPTSQPRPIVNIALDADSVAAVADDGTAWWLSGDGTTWTQMPALPKREADRAAGLMP